jgi:hypothetical protein
VILARVRAIGPNNIGILLESASTLANPVTATSESTSGRPTPAPTGSLPAAARSGVRRAHLWKSGHIIFKWTTSGVRLFGLPP